MNAEKTTLGMSGPALSAPVPTKRTGLLDRPVRLIRVSFVARTAADLAALRRARFASLSEDDVAQYRFEVGKVTIEVLDEGQVEQPGWDEQ